MTAALKTLPRNVSTIVSLAVLLASPALAQEFWSPKTKEAIDRKPVLTITPTYPKKAREYRRQGRVVVCFGIRADGRVRKPYVLASTSREFSKPALRAIAQSKFEPVADGTPELEACRTFRFTLEPEPQSSVAQ